MELQEVQPVKNSTAWFYLFLEKDTRIYLVLLPVAIRFPLGHSVDVQSSTKRQKSISKTPI